MTPKDTSHTIEQWLGEAVRGIPKAEHDTVAAEISAHFADAVEDYKSEGMDEAKAIQSALADLGDPRETFLALRENVVARRWYIVAAIFGAIFSVLAFAGFNLGESLSPTALGKAVQDVLILAPTFVVLLIFARLLKHRTGDSSHTPPIQAIVAAMFLANAAIDVRLALHPPLPNSFPWEMTAGGPEIVLVWTSLVGLFGTALGLFWLGTTLLRLDDAMYGLRQAILSIAILTGLAVFAFALGIVSGELMLAELANIAALILHLTIMAILSLLFTRVLLRPRGKKLQTA